MLWGARKMEYKAAVSILFTFAVAVESNETRDRPNDQSLVKWLDTS